MNEPNDSPVQKKPELPPTTNHQPTHLNEPQEPTKPMPQPIPRHPFSIGTGNGICFVRIRKPWLDNEMPVERNYFPLHQIMFIAFFIAFFLGFHRSFYLPIFPSQALYFLAVFALSVYLIQGKFHTPLINRLVMELPLKMLDTSTNISARVRIASTGLILKRLLPYLGIILWGMLVTLLWAENTWIATENILRWVLGLIFVVGLCKLLIHYPKIQQWLFTWLLLGIAAGTIGYQISIASYENHIEGRFGFPFGNATLAGTVLGFGFTVACMQIILACSQLAHSAKDDNAEEDIIPAKDSDCESFFPVFSVRQNIILLFVNIPIALLLAVTLWQCRAKSGILSTILAIVIIVAIRRWSFHKVAKVLIGLGVLFILSVGIFWSTTSHPSLATMVAPSPSLEFRYWVWDASIKMFCSDILRFLFGYGPGNFLLQFPYFVNPQFHASTYAAGIVDCAHNWTIEMITEYGLVGFALWLILVMKVLQWAYLHAQNMTSDHTWALMAGLLMLLADFQFSTSYHWGHGQILFDMTIAWLITTSHIEYLKSEDDIMPSSDGQNERKPMPRYLSFTRWGILLALVALGAKFLIVDPGRFYYTYYQAVHEKHPLQRAQQMLDVPLPATENFYTLLWATELSLILYDAHPYQPKILWNNISKLERLEHDAPRFSQFGLYRAMIATIIFDPPTTSAYFAEFAEVDSCVPNLWVWWYQQSMKGLADPAVMLATVREKYAQFPRDSAVQLGYALGLRLQNDMEGSRKMCAQIIEFVYARDRLYGSTVRGREVIYWADHYSKN